MIRGERLRAAGIVAATAGLLGGAGDILLFSTPGFSADLFVVESLPLWRSLAGTLLAISVIPFLSLGYWAFSRYLTGIRELYGTIVMVGGIYGVGLGNAIHGTVGTLVRVIQVGELAGQEDFLLAAFAPLVVPLYAAFYVLMGAGTLWLAVVIWRGQSEYPRWFILLLPLWSNVLVLPVARLVPAAGDILIPSIANLSHALLFAVMTALMWGREATSATRSSAPGLPTTTPLA